MRSAFHHALTVAGKPCTTHSARPRLCASGCWPSKQLAYASRPNGCWFFCAAGSAPDRRELWQLDASPHRWFPTANLPSPCSIRLDDQVPPVHRPQILRARTAALLLRLPASEPSWLTGGRCNSTLIIAASFYPDPDALTVLGLGAHFYDISLRYASRPGQGQGRTVNTGKFWQGWLPAYFASEKNIGNRRGQPARWALRAHRNAHEVHRGTAPDAPAGLESGQKGKPLCRCARPRPAPGGITSGVSARPSRSGTYLSRAHRHPTPAHPKPPETKVVLCLHPSGLSLRAGLISQ